MTVDGQQIDLLETKPLNWADNVSVWNDLHSRLEELAAERTKPATIEWEADGF